MKKLTLLLLFGGLAAAQAPPPVTVLAPGASLLGPGTLLDAWVADLDGDGDDDLIAANRTEGSVYVDVQSWRGAVQTRVVLGAFPRVERVAALDIDLDGDMDVVVGNDNVGVQLLRRDGPGLDQWTLLPLIARRAADKNRFVVTDLDGDGHPDLSIEDLERHVVFARADGLAPQRLTAAEYGAPTLFGDVDGDGDVDGVTEGADGVVWLRNDGALPWTPVPVPLEGPLALLADVDPAPGLELIGRGDPDMLIALNQTGAGGTFGPWTAIPVESHADADALDVDGDGDLDLVGVADELWRTALLLENLGGGAWRQTLGSFDAVPDRFGRPSWSDVTDLNGDDALDLFVLFNNTRDAYGYVLGRGAATARATAPAGATVEGGVTLAPVVVEMTRVAPDGGPLHATGLELLLVVDDGPADGAIEHVDVFVESTGDDALGPGDVPVARAQPAGPETTIPLDHPALTVGFDPALRLYVQAQLTPRAHLAGATLRVGWLAASAAWDGGPVGVVGERPTSAAWTLDNQPPIATPDGVDVLEGSTTRLDLLANDAEPQGDPLRVEIVQPPAHGLIEIGDDGEATYIHDDSELPLVDTLTYRAVDGGGAASEVVEVIIAIEPVDEPPIGAPDAYVTDEDTPLRVEPDLGLLFDDVDPEGAILTVHLERGPSHGQLELDPDGGFLYLPAPDFAGLDTFSYRPDDGGQLGDPVEVEIEVRPVNDVPRPATVVAQTTARTPIRLQLSEGDPEGADAWLLIEAFPDHGHLIDLDPAAAAVTYVPPFGFAGEARFTFRLSDGRAVSTPHEAVVRVAPEENP
ncbi:MAG: Ig-like domain-containing protein [Myxococcales bacterium]|nr:Ig-like domain-containing protein [Myxococcales bacterium]